MSVSSIMDAGKQYEIITRMWVRQLTFLELIIKSKLTLTTLEREVNQQHLELVRLTNFYYVINL